MTQATKLKVGLVYDTEALVFCRWSTPTGDYPGAHVADYFDSDGRYLGPDVDGVEPLFSHAR